MIQAIKISLSMMKSSDNVEIDSYVRLIAFYDI